MIAIQKVKTALLVSVSLLVAGCGDNPQEQMVRQAAAIESADECHLCGMVIANFPGPKGEAYEKGREAVEKFCSTRDLFAYLLQPENQRQIQQVFVHDMSKTPWQKPQDDYFIDAKTAWYVIGSNQTGSMGPTLASFSQQQDAQAFSEEFGGQVYTFEQIRLDML